MTQIALAYRGLTPIDAVKPRTTADDELFRELAATLAKHNALDRFGICLLHTHFNIAEGETLLESTDAERREQWIRPIRLTEAEPLDLIETAWRLEGNGSTAMSCKCIRDSAGVHIGHFPTR